MNATRTPSLVFVSLLLLMSPLSVASPPAPTNLRFLPGSHEAMTWDQVPGVAEYGLYLGRIEAGTPFTLNHRCAASEIPDNYAEAHAVPDPGSATYYVIESLERDPETGMLVCGDPAWWNQLRCGARVFVDPDAAGAGTGLSWANAFTTLSAALNTGAGPGWSACGTEVWIHGDLRDEIVNLQDNGVHLLGGFGGQEGRAWERDPGRFPTSFIGRIYDPEEMAHRLVVEDLSMGSGGKVLSFIQEFVSLYVELQSVTFTQYGEAAVFASTTESPGQVIVHGCRFLGGPSYAIHADTLNGMLELSVTDSDFAGDGSASVFLESRADGYPIGFPQVSTVEVSRSRFRGGMTGVLLVARNYGESVGVDRHVEAKLHTNVFHDLTADAVALRATLTGRRIPAWPGDHLIATISADVTGNTISDIGGTGLTCSASTGSASDPADLDRCTCRVRAWDNLITYTGGYAVSESAPYQDFVDANVEMVGNDCYSNLACLLDDGTSPMTNPADVNGLPGNADNWSDRPVYRLRSARDYHLGETSPAIDRGHLGVVFPWTLDIDFEPRPRDGDGDGIALPDVGADEF